MTKHEIQFTFIKHAFIALSFSESLATKFIPLILIVQTDAISFNTLDNLPIKICVPNKTEDMNAKVFNMITRINEAKALTK